MAHYFSHLVDQNGRAYFTYQAMSRWLGLYIEIIGLLWITGVLLFSYFTIAHDSTDAS